MSDSQQAVAVKLADGQYNIHVTPGLLGEVGPQLALLLPARRAVVMTDSHLAALHGAAVAESCKKAGIEIVAQHIVPAGEEHKTLDQVQAALDVFLRARVERSTPILAVGGGVIGDMAGFVAAILLRGVPFVQIPTSLLAMVDASIGGKTGVNHAVGKNLIGAFHQPVVVFADPLVLRTLPRAEFVGGLAECIKHELIRDADGFGRLERNIDSILQLDMNALTELVRHNVRIKAQVVQADPFERGERAHLNFGHTFGHAIEIESKFSYSHGQSVALGMTAAAYVSQELKLIDETARRRIVGLIEKSGLPVRGMSLDADRVVEAMRFDKKVKGSRIRFVLLDGIGRATIRDDVPDPLVRDAVESLRG